MFASLSIPNARKPRASVIDIGSPFAFGGVAGKKSENTAATNATPAAHASGMFVPSIEMSNIALAPSANTAAQTQPRDPNTLM